MNFLECINCKSEYPMDETLYNCKKCGDLLEVKLDLEDLKLSLIHI